MKNTHRASKYQCYQVIKVLHRHSFHYKSEISTYVLTFIYKTINKNEIIKIKIFQKNKNSAKFPKLYISYKWVSKSNVLKITSDGSILI